jgi:hypothetical protein
MITVEASPGSANANSYCSVAVAESYFATSYKRTEWSEAATDHKAMALVEATRLLDNLVSWAGYRATSLQSLKFPRTQLIDYDAPADASSSYLSSVDIPKFLVCAVCELAYDILKNSGFSAQENDLSDVKVGPLSISFSDKVKVQGFSQVVQAAISKWGSYELMNSSAVSQPKLVRV